MIFFSKLSIFVRWCPKEVNKERPGIAELYSISYLYLGTIGFLSAFLVGSISSYIVWVWQEFEDL